MKTKMKITADSRFMHNQKNAIPHTVSGNSKFEVVKTSDGYTLFFHVSDDGKLWITREVPATSTGWTQDDITPVVTTNHPTASKTTVKHFAISQNTHTSSEYEFDLLIVMSVTETDGIINDHVYMALNQTHTAADSWTAVEWQYLRYDAQNHDAPSPFSINRAYCMNYTGQNEYGDPATCNNVVIDVTVPNDDLKRFQRFYLEVNASPGEVNTSPVWYYHSIAEDFSIDGHQSCLGRRSDDLFEDNSAGVYTFGHLIKPQLVYSPNHDFLNDGGPPGVVPFPVPNGATAIVSVPIHDDSGSTNLYVAGQNGLYLFAAKYQGIDPSTGEVPSAEQVYTATTNLEKQLFTNVTSMMATKNAGKTTIWMLNQANQLFYTACMHGQEQTATAWIRPVCIKSNVQNFSFYVNTTTVDAGADADQTTHFSDSLFTSQVVNNESRSPPIVRLTRDPVAGLWYSTTIALALSDPQHIQEQTTFTTQIKLMCVNNQPQGETPLVVRATGLLAAYFNNVYHVINVNDSLTVNTDSAGGLSVVQDRSTFSTSVFSVTAGDGTVLHVDPTAYGYTQLQSVTSPAILKSLPATDRNGVSSPLCPPMSDDDAQTTVDAFQTLVSAKSTVLDHQLQSGKRFSEIPQLKELHRPELMMDFSLGGWFSDVVDDVGNVIQSAADAIEHGIEVVKDVVQTVVKGIVHLAVTLAGDVYRVALDTVSAISHAVVFVFNKIKVAIERLISWIGFLFEWPDILRTHNVMKNLFIQYAQYRVGNICCMKKRLNNHFDDIKNKMRSFIDKDPKKRPAGIDKITAASHTVSSQQSGLSSSSADGPQMHWGTNHTRHHASSAQSSYNSKTKVTEKTNTLFGTLVSSVEREGEAFKQAFEKIKTEVCDQIHDQSAITSALDVLDILLELVLESAEIFFDTFLEIVEDMIQGMIDMMNTPLDIPIISPMYRIATGGSFNWDFTVSGGDQLTLLDLTCLVVAIPITLIYKVQKNKAPFPDDSVTQALIDAKSFDAIKQILGSTPSSQHPSPSMYMMASADEQKMKIDAVSTSVVDKISYACNIAALFGSIGVDIIFATKCSYSDAQKPVPKSFSLLGAVFWIPYASPAIPQSLQDSLDPVQVMNDVAAGIAFLKMLFDTAVSCVPSQDTPSGVDASFCALYGNYASPILDTVINIFWLGPAIGGLVESIESNDGLSPQALVGFLANVAFDIGGIIAPGTSIKIVVDPDTVTAFQASVVVLNLLYGFGSFVLNGFPS